MCWWTIMQHFGCPTRLIDWTYSPFVALYFAVDSGYEADGIVYCFFTDALYVKNKENYPEINFYEQFDSLLNQKIVECIISNFHSERSIAQQGCFTVCTDISCDHEMQIDETLGTIANKNCFKLRINKNVKLEFLSRLRTVNVTGNSLFPDLGGFGKSLRDLAEIRCWEKMR